MSKHSVTTSCWSWGERDGKLRHEMVSRVSRAARGRTVTRHPRRLRQSDCKQCAWTADQIFLRLLHCNNCKKNCEKSGLTHWCKEERAEGGIFLCKDLLRYEVSISQFTFMTTLEIFATRTSPIFFPFFSFLENGHMGNKIALKMCSSRFILYFDIVHLSKSLSYQGQYMYRFTRYIIQSQFKFFQ